MSVAVQERRKAFTLIELLVVLAIVAVLASLLFPVFQSARDSARRATCASNFRQTFIASQLYSNDYDDRFTLVNHQGSQTARALKDKTWVQLVLPYLRSFTVFRCPSDYGTRPRPEATFDQDLVPGDTYSMYYSASKRSNIGFNYLYLAPIVQVGEQHLGQPRFLSSVANPSRTLLYADSVWELSPAGHPRGGGSWLITPPCRYLPGNKDTMDYGARLFAFHRGWSTAKNSALRYGQVWPWHTMRANVMWVDGSARSMTVEDLSAGCVVKSEWRGDILNTDDYIWDFQ